MMKTNTEYSQWLIEQSGWTLGNFKVGFFGTESYTTFLFLNETDKHIILYHQQSSDPNKCESYWIVTKDDVHYKLDYECAREYMNSPDTYNFETE